MRHGKKFNHLGRTASHRSAMLSNMASSLIIHKRITTTVAKAKALRKYVEPLLTKSKEDTTHNRRVVFSYLQNKESIKELFDNVSEKIAERPGGYTRIIKTSYRLGDNADMCIMELVDFNELMLSETAAGKSKTRRGRRKKSSKPEVSAPVASSPKAEVKETVEAEVSEELPLSEDQEIEPNTSQESDENKKDESDKS
ncbi:MAG: 50S ribosomal protein L17 [Cyclobacteriaceae bacterium]|nr:50S ribosomal protein L17 [Cyclobacteriaceae bacterium]